MQRCPQVPRRRTRSTARPAPDRPTARRSCRCCRRVPAASGPAAAPPSGHRAPHRHASRSPRPAASFGDAASCLARRPRPPMTRLEIAAGTPGISASACCDNRLAGDRAQRRLLRRLPHDRVAAHQRRASRSTPRPRREIERRDHADRPQRMPLLGQPMAGPLAGDRLAVQLPAQARRRSRRCRSSPALRRALPA